jgi:phospholipase/lecithinase/hemolysin
MRRFYFAQGLAMAAVALLAVGSPLERVEAQGFAVSNPYASTGSTTSIAINKALVFGDSYSRANRTSFRNWIEQLRYNVTNKFGHKEVSSLLDFGVGAATGGNYPNATNDFAHQITTALATKPSFGPHDLTLVYFGYNDFNRTQANTGVSLSQAFLDYKAGLQRLVNAGVGGGGRRIFLIMPHDWGHTPHWSALGKSAEIRQQAVAWNAMMADLAQKSAYTHLVAVDIFTAIECVFNQPADFGFINVSDSRPNGADPWTYLYDWDTYHFAEHGYTIIRQVVQYYLTRGWDWSNTYKDPDVAHQKLLADLRSGRVFGVKCTSL